MTDTTTSPERQLAECRKLCEQRGYEVVGVAEDLDVSGSVDPFNRKHRPNLARWLAGEHEAFDVIVVYRVDRLTLSIRHLQGLGAWAEDHGKLIVSATEPHFDMTTPFAAVVIALMGTVAQMELEAISERNASAARHNIRAGKYRGSQPPWGYKPQKDDAGAWRLVQDSEQVKVIEEAKRRVLTGEPLQRIAHDLTRRGVPTPKDRFAELQGRPTKSTSWNVTPLKRSLTSEAMLGHAVSAGKSVRNDDGSPVVRSTPILTREEFEAIRVELAGRAKRGEPNTRTSSLLLRVIYCGMPCSHKRNGEVCPDDCPGICGEAVYKFNGGSHSQFPRYRCRTMTKAAKCGNRTIRMDEVDRLVDGVIVRMLGASERLEREWDSGSDNSAELAEINTELEDLAEQLGSPAFRKGTPQRARLDARIEALATRQATLEAESTTPSGWVWRGSGENFGDWWEQQDIEGRNIWLRSMGVRVEYDREQVRLDLGDLYALTEQMHASGPVADWQAALEEMRDRGLRGLVLGTGDSLSFVPAGD